MPVVPLSLLAKGKVGKVGKALANAAKPVTDAMCTNESLLSRRINAIERLGELQFLINGVIVSGELEEDAGEVFDELKKFYLQTRSFFNKKVSSLLSDYMVTCRNLYLSRMSGEPNAEELARWRSGEPELEAIMEDLEFELRCSVSPLPLHIWLRLVKYHLTPVVIFGIIFLVFFLLSKEFVWPWEEAAVGIPC